MRRINVVPTIMLLAVVLWLISCTRTFVPSGRPGCPNRSVWSDSAQRCIAREGR